MRHWLLFTVGGLCLVLASAAQALGVGEPQRISALNRPLHVVLPLTDSMGLTPEAVSVSIADDAAYRQAGLTRSALADVLSAKVERRADGLAVVLDSPRRVREPFVDLLLVVTWPDGQWQRQVSILFDPLDYASSQPLLEGSVTANSARTQAPTPSAPPAAVPSSSPEFSTALASGPVPWPSRLQVRSGDTLSRLATSLLPRDGISRQSLMLALYQANPAAFMANDIDRLRAGSELHVPPSAVVARLSRDEAVSRLRELTRRDSGDRPTIDIEAASASISSPPTALAPDSPALVTLQQRVATLSAETERQRATIAALEAQRDRLQASLAAVSGAVRPSAEPRRENSDDDGSADGVLPSHAAATTASASDATTTPGQAAATAAAAPGEPSLSPKSAPASTPALWQRLPDWGGALTTWIGGAALVVLLLLWSWQRRRARRAGTAPVVDRQVIDEDDASTPRSETGRQTAAAADVESASISQADIYIAYGRYAEARDWLRQRLTQEDDPRLRLSLIRMLGELRDMDAMEETLAGLGESATREQRRQAQDLVDDYRARHVEESWQEATADAAESVEDSTDVDGTETLFDAPQAHHEVSIEVVDAGEPTHVDTSAREPAGDVRPGAGLDTPGPADRDFEPAPQATSIEYQAPALDFDPPQSLPQDAPSDPPPELPNSTAMPEIDFASLALEPLSHAAGTSAAEPERTARTQGEHPVPGAGSESGLHARRQREPDSDRGVPSGWDVEEVEFQSLHRDNSRP
ncbi:FimV/HubP family polar landmark protein [Salinicola peritrichatus]|uniref:FimV/HubP family polar landmark protein n=1 Tax=Salinicola peritrichatus TaxID=1267424 RepID=UPI000DA137B9|nr:FimV/HubP family polar landmark protein [Salinicola peritrichatus]